MREDVPERLGGALLVPFGCGLADLNSLRTGHSLSQPQRLFMSALQNGFVNLECQEC